MSPPNIPNPGKVKAVRGEKVKGKRGPLGHFQGSRLAFLNSHIPEYKSLKKGARHGFWHRLYTTWWQRYPWKLDDNEEPPENDTDKMAQLGSVAPDEKDWKGKTEKQLTDRLTQWFVNHATVKADVASTLDWVPLLKRLHQLHNPRPRQRTPVQQFTLDHPEIVNAAFVSQYSEGKGLSGPQKMNILHKLAKDLLSTSYADLKSALDKKAATQHAVDMEEWDLILDGISSAEDITRARDSLFEAVHPLIEAIGAYAGCYVSLIAGSPQKDDASGFFTALHWWPGDHGSTRNWAKWDEDAFSSGVAGPFLAYANETDKISQTTKDGMLSDVEISQASLPPTPHSVPVTNSVQRADGHASARTQSLTATTAATATTTTVPRTSYRPLPTKKTALIPIRGTKKRKRAPGPHSDRYFDDEWSEDNDSGESDSDGSSSVPSNTPAPEKRQRTSKIVTRASTRAHRLDSDTPSNPLSPPLAIGTQPPLVIPEAGTASPVDGGSADTSALVGPPKPMSIDISPNAPDTDHSPSGDVTSVSAEPPTDAGNTLIIGIGTYCDAVTPPDNDSGTTINTSTEPVIDTRSTAPSSIPAITSITAITPATTIVSSSPPLGSLNINADSVPDFLLCHGKGKRRVNIFLYLNEVKDRRFQQVLFDYIQFEANDRSGKAGSLSTTGRPVEIGRWTVDARPADLPVYTKGKRTFTDFVDSIFVWWGSLQPPWRLFERGKVSREVQGGWDCLRAPRINGLLNIVVLVYWWGRILEEQKPEAGVRADYEQFADDVAWVFSNLST